MSFFNIFFIFFLSSLQGNAIKNSFIFNELTLDLLEGIKKNRCLLVSRLIAKVVFGVEMAELVKQHSFNGTSQVNLLTQLNLPLE